MKTGLYFGSFNPIHIGHLAIANYFLEFTDLDRVWFVISPQNPLKKRNTLLADYHRFELVQRAIGDDPDLRAMDIEFKLPKPSYTIDTLAYLSEWYPHDDFILIMGEDNLSTLYKWKNHEKLIQQYEFYVYPRVEDGNDPGSGIHSLYPGARIRMADAPRIEISSSFIRESIRNKKNIRYFLPKEVWAYIDEMNFYR